MKRATSLVLALAGGEVPGAEAEGPAAVTVTSEPMDACAAGYQVSYMEACGAFAAMLSGYAFGPSGNPARKLEDNAQVRPGDRLELSCTLVKEKGPVGIGEAVATVDGKVAARAMLTFAVET